MQVESSKLEVSSKCSGPRADRLPSVEDLDGNPGAIGTKLMLELSGILRNIGVQRLPSAFRLTELPASAAHRQQSGKKQQFGREAPGLTGGPINEPGERRQNSYANCGVNG